MKCSDVMTKDPTYCLPADTVDKAAQLMKDEDVGAIPAVADHETKRLLGIVTDRDLALKVVARGHNPLTIKVEDVMTFDPITCHPNDDLKQVVEAMEKYQVRRIPVVDDRDRLVGIISQADIATRMAEPETIAEVVEEISKSKAASG